MLHNLEMLDIPTWHLCFRVGNIVSNLSQSVSLPIVLIVTELNFQLPFVILLMQDLAFLITEKT